MKGRYAAFAIAGVLGLGLAWIIVANALATHLAESRPAVAVRLVRDEPQALTMLAQDASDRSQPEQARVYARRALQAAPLSVEAYRVLAVNTDAASPLRVRLLGAGWALSRRDPAIAFDLYRQAMGEARYDAALDYADAMFRRAPQTRGVAFPELIAATTDPKAVDVLVERLAKAPPWRQAFLQELGRRAPSYEIATTVLRRLAAGRTPPTPAETTTLFNTMISGADYADAYAAWASFLPASSRPTSTGVFDDHFKFAPGPPPFGWDVRLTNGNQARLEPAANGSGLQIYAAGFKGGSVARQMMVLPPGPYRLISSGRVVEGSQSELEWRLVCGRRILMRSPFTLYSGQAGGSVEADVSLPADCPVQWLVLSVVGGERGGATMAVLDRASLEPVDQ